MGSVLTALYNLRSWGKQPHVNSHCDCSCSNDSSSSDEPKVKEKKTWLDKHRPAHPKHSK